MLDFAWVHTFTRGLIEAEGRVLFGAFLGAVLITIARGPLIIVARRRLSLASKVVLVMLAFGVGYLFEPLLTSLVPKLTRGMSAFVAAVLVIPLCLKVMVWLDAVDLREILQRWRR